MNIERFTYLKNEANKLYSKLEEALAKAPNADKQELCDQWLRYCYQAIDIFTVYDISSLSRCTEEAIVFVDQYEKFYFKYPKSLNKKPMLALAICKKIERYAVNIHESNQTLDNVPLITSGEHLIIRQLVLIKGWCTARNSKEIEKNLALLSPSVREVYAYYEYAISLIEDIPKRITDRFVYEWIDNYVGNDSNINNYTLPPLKTWCRYMIRARNILNQPKNRRRHSRKSRSIASPNDM